MASLQMTGLSASTMVNSVNPKETARDKSADLCAGAPCADKVRIGQNDFGGIILPLFLDVQGHLSVKIDRHRRMRVMIAWQLRQRCGQEVSVLGRRRSVVALDVTGGTTAAMSGKRPWVSKTR